MKNIKYTFFLLAFLPLLVSAYMTEKYDDKAENKIIVTPAKLELKLSPGQVINQEMTVINRLGRREKVQIVVEGLIGKESLLNLDKNYFPNSGADWIEPEINEIYLDHGERVKFNIQIKVPGDVKAGGYYVGVLAAVESIGGENDNVEFVNRVGTSILMTIPGQVKEDMALVKFSSDKKFYLNGPVKLFTEALNLGNIHLSPSGEIAVYNFLGKKVAQIPLSNALILPGQSQKWKSSWNEKWILGIYKAHLTMRYGEGNNQIAEREIKFWAFPIHILVIIILIIYIVHKLIKKWQEKYEVKKKVKTEN